MILFRMAAEAYKDDLSGTGAKLFGGRWNTPGVPALYTTENISLSVLEILVHTGLELVPLLYYLLRLELPANASVQVINRSKLKKEWKSDTAYTQWIGNEFLKADKALALKIPSVIVEEEHNFIINTNHPDFKKIKILSSRKFSFDKRFHLRHE